MPIAIKKFLTLQPRSQLHKILQYLDAKSLENQELPVETYLEHALQQVAFKEILEKSEVYENVKNCMDEALAYSKLEKNNNQTLHIRHRLRMNIERAYGSTTAEWDLEPPEVKNHDSNESTQRFPYAVYCEDIRSPFNIGNIFRSAEFFGFKEIVLSPHCPSPLENTRLIRSSMGTCSMLPWSKQSLETWLDGLGSLAPYAPNCPVIALETGAQALNKATLPNRGIVLLGSEELGLSPHLLKIAQQNGCTISIPSYGKKTSLNVGVSFGIFAATWTQKFCLPV
jgi:TrmH family RNA methyltransferase